MTQIEYEAVTASAAALKLRDILRELEMQLPINECTRDADRLVNDVRIAAMQAEYMVRKVGYAKEQILTP